MVGIMSIILTDLTQLIVYIVVIIVLIVLCLEGNYAVSRNRIKAYEWVYNSEAGNQCRRAVDALLELCMGNDFVIAVSNPVTLDSLGEFKRFKPDKYVIECLKGHQISAVRYLAEYESQYVQSLEEVREVYEDMNKYIEQGIVRGNKFTRYQYVESFRHLRNVSVYKIKNQSCVEVTWKYSSKTKKQSYNSQQIKEMLNNIDR